MCCAVCLAVFASLIRIDTDGSSSEQERPLQRVCGKRHGEHDGMTAPARAKNPQSHSVTDHCCTACEQVIHACQWHSLHPQHIAIAAPACIALLMWVPPLNRRFSASCEPGVRGEMRKAARKLVNTLHKFLIVAAQQQQLGRSSGFPLRVVEVATALHDALRSEVRGAGRPPGSVKRTSRQQARRICKMARALKQKDAELAQREQAHQSFSSMTWAVSAGLSDPNTSTRSVETWCREFNHEAAPLSHSYVSCLRNVLGELLLGMNRKDVKAFVAAAPGRFLVIKHLHDEATMRLRSTAAPAVMASTAAPAVRIRSSKIQNAVVTLHVAPDTMLPMLVELQPLMRKDARTIASSLRSVVGEVCRDAPSQLRVVHCIVGDGVATNAAAARLLWHVMMQDGSRLFSCSSFLRLNHLNQVQKKLTSRFPEVPAGEHHVRHAHSEPCGPDCDFVRPWA